LPRRPASQECKKEPVGGDAAPALSVAASGVVFGDTGTSPRYTLKTVLGLVGGTPAKSVALGTLSLLISTPLVVSRDARRQ
jgi:K+ transporter